MSDVMYKQCRLERKVDEGMAVDVAWLPAKFAIPDKILEIRQGGVWENGWRVVDASESVLPEKLLNRNSRDHLKTRVASDI